MGRARPARAGARGPPEARRGPGGRAGVVGVDHPVRDGERRSVDPGSGRVRAPEDRVPPDGQRRPRAARGPGVDAAPGHDCRDRDPRHSRGAVLRARDRWQVDRDRVLGAPERVRRHGGVDGREPHRAVRRAGVRRAPCARPGRIHRSGAVRARRLAQAPGREAAGDGAAARPGGCGRGRDVRELAVARRARGSGTTPVCPR